MDKTFLKWAGGKNWLVRNYQHLFPNEYNRYIDPFLGGGAVYFYLEPEEAILSDINSELITTYLAIKDEWEDVYRYLRKHNKNHSSDYYYYMRNMSTRRGYTKAARMIYLNRTCFNGIYRVNSKGKFNVPKGTSNTVLLETDDFQRRSELLQSANILCQDFQITIDISEEGDLLFCDPPYYINENNGFIGYTERLFNWNDQVRLAEALHRAKNRGVKIIMTNVSHKSIRELYDGIDGYCLEEVERYCSISGNAKSRQKYKELIITANL